LYVFDVFAPFHFLDRCLEECQEGDDCFGPIEPQVLEQVIVPFKATFDVVLGILSMSFRKAAGSKGVQQRVA
jgi:hypothetical protein